MAEAPGLLNKSVSCYRVVSAMEKNSKEEGQWKVGVANMNRVTGEVVGERVPCAKDMKTMRGEPGRCLEENVLGNENSKVVTWLGPWAGPRKQNGAVTLIVQSLVPTLRILTFPLSEMGAKTGLAESYFLTHSLMCSHWLSVENKQKGGKDRNKDG